MELTVHVHMHEADKAEILHAIHLLRKLIMTSQAQLASDLQAVATQIAKIGAETTALLTKITDLEAALAAGGVTTAEVDAALQALKDQAKVVDDMVPDAPAP